MSSLPLPLFPPPPHPFPPPLPYAPTPPFLVLLLFLILFHLLLLLFLLIILFFLTHFLLVLLFITIMEGEAEASPLEKGLWARETSYLLVPLLQLHFLATASSDDRSLTFFPLSMVILGQIKLTKHIQTYSTLHVENCDI